MTESLEPRVDLTATCIARMSVASVGIALPDLNADVAQWFTIAVKQRAAQVSRLAPGDSGFPRDMNEIVVVIERQISRVKRARGLPWGEKRRRCRRHCRCQQTTGGHYDSPSLSLHLHLLDATIF
jgi:hypothetical protein